MRRLSDTIDDQIGVPLGGCDEADVGDIVGDGHPGHRLRSQEDMSRGSHYKARGDRQTWGERGAKLVSQLRVQEHRVDGRWGVGLGPGGGTGDHPLDEIITPQIPQYCTTSQ